MRQDRVVDPFTRTPRHPMFHQAQVLSDTIRRERALAVSPANLERRQAGRLLEALRCCTGPSLLARLGALVDRPSTTCCAPV
jgi:hypothetical protein